MKKTLQNLALLFLLLVTGVVYAQSPVLTISCPASADEWVTITYYADNGCTPEGKTSVAGLPYIAIHSGVTTAAGGNWQFVKGWNDNPDNIQATKMFREGTTNVYKISFMPREFYGVPAGEEVLGINCVFNGSDNDPAPWSSEGKDPNSNCGDFALTFASCTGTGIGGNVQNAVQLHNYPNPFTTATQISYTTQKDGEFASLKVYNLQGQVVKVLTAANHIAGQHYVSWDGMDADGNAVAGGQYLITLETETQVSSAKMLIIR
ncbi:MAG TPA: FlgD immunoglobulin-like domain containing protein [Chitinophagales bacterium]|nr:FlgD immunoglobulin-like domain containing protein [Chitinophagales bacterium]HRK27146.1 FlgD immunoglobulin-like domain containing protein [Chitinophagales bacterium]